MTIINHYITELQQTLDLISHQHIQQAIDWLHNARINGRKIFIMGNGGSASTASHFVCDLAKNTRRDDLPPFRVIGLADNMALLSAYGNDEGYENVFAQQLLSLAQPKDIVIAISTSGNSPNVVNAVNVAQELQMRSIGFTGFTGGQLANIVDLDLRVPSNCIEQVEDIHVMLEHLICKALREYHPLTSQSISTKQMSVALETEWN